MTSEPIAASRPPLAVQGAKHPNPSSTRAATNRRRRLVELARQGNVNALRHGIVGEVANREDAALEADLIYVTHPGLDPLRDRRLVEQLAMNTVQLARCDAAMAVDGMTAVLTAYRSKLAPLVERQARGLAAVERERLAANAGVDPLKAYRP